MTASSAARGAVFKVDFEIDGSEATGQYTVTLLQNVLHVDDDANDENDASVTLAIKVTDSDGSFDDTGSLAITFDDDTPVAFDDVISDIQEDGGSVQIDVFADNGNGADSFGADGVSLPDGLNVVDDVDSGALVTRTAVPSFTRQTLISPATTHSLIR